jgi:isoamylase
MMMRNAALAFFLIGCASDDYTRLYHTEDKAPSLSWEDITELEHLGPTLVDRGVNFGVYSAHATRIEVLLFDDPESARPTAQFEMFQADHVYNLYVEGVGAGQHYGYVAWGPNFDHEPSFHPGSLEGFRADVDEQGNRFNPNKLLIDPYAKAVHRDHDWWAGSAASGPHREQSTWGAGAKSVVVDSQYAWSSAEAEWLKSRKSDDHPGHGAADLILYETHVKGLSNNAASAQFGVTHPGTYRGVGEMAGYLADLGITAVELLPVHEKPGDGGYWGYNNLSYFALEVGYSHTAQSGGEPGEIVDEFKWMVDQLHQHGVEVILDVVYNHTGEGGLWRTKLFFDDPGGDYLCDPGNAIALDSSEVASILSWRGLDNASYYTLADANQSYWDDSTGVGNQTRANHRPMRKQILHSLRYFVEEMHVDGFRFDLAGVLGEADSSPSEYWGGTSAVADTILQEIVDDPVLQERHTRLIAEPWTAKYDGSTLFPVATGSESYAWAEWNANYRDWWRSFLNDDGWTLNSAQGVDGGAVITGSYDRYAWNGRQPHHSVNFITAHDGFTLFDLLSYGEKENGCGPLNPVCCDDACSVWCDPTSGDSNNHSRNWDDAPQKRQMFRNALVGMALSHGSVMMHGGDEWMRTKYGNNNSYTTGADNDWNWYRWGEWTSRNTNNTFRHRMHDFTRQLWRLRKERSHAFARTSWDSGMPFSWKDEFNGEATDATWGSRHIAMHYHDDGNWAGTPELLVLINMEQDPVSFILPEGRTWAMILDTGSWYDTPGTSGEPTGWFDENLDVDPFLTANIRLEVPVAAQGNYTVSPRSIVMLEQQGVR